MGSALVAFLAFAAPCHADEPAPITVVAGARGALAHRLSQELEAAGLRVRIEATRATVGPGALFIVIPEEDAGPIEIWSGSESRSRLVASVAPEGTLDTRVLRTAELLRALVPAAPDAAAPAARPAVVTPGPPQPPPVVPSLEVPSEGWRTLPMYAWVPTPPPPPFLLPAPSKGALLDVGIAAALGLQAQGASMALDASFRLWPHARVGVGLWAEVPVVGPEIAAREGHVRFRPAFFGAELATAPIARTGRFGLVLSPGVGLCYVSVSGNATPSYAASDESAFVATVYGRGEVRTRLIDALSVTVGALGGASIPPVDVRFAGRLVSTFRAYASLSLGVVVQR